MDGPQAGSMAERKKSAWSPFTWIRWLYDWVLAFSDSPHAVWALFLIAVAESSFFPIPPDILLIAMCVAVPRRAFWFALVCLAGSLLGAVFGYLLGFYFFEWIGAPIIRLYGAEGEYARVQTLYDEWNAIAVGIAGFTPIPYKVFTIAAGAFQINFVVFMVASALSRGARFFLLGALIRKFGPGIRDYIDRYFNLLTIAFVVLFLAGLLIVRYII